MFSFSFCFIVIPALLLHVTIPLLFHHILLLLWSCFKLWFTPTITLPISFIAFCNISHQELVSCKPAPLLFIIHTCQLRQQEAKVERKGEKLNLNWLKTRCKKDGSHSASCGKTVPTDIWLHSPPRTEYFYSKLQSTMQFAHVQ